MNKKYLTKKELGRELGLTKRGVEELMRTRKIPFLLLGHRTVRFVPGRMLKNRSRDSSTKPSGDRIEL